MIKRMPLIAASLLTTALLGLALPGPAARATEYRLGLLLPFSGVYAGLGDHIEKGFRLGLDTFGPQLEGERITTVVADTEADPAASLAKAKKMVFQDRVDALVGVVSSAVLGALRDFVHRSDTPLVVANAGNVHATGRDCSPRIVRVSFSNRQITGPMGSWMSGQGIRSAWLMAPDYAAGHQMMNAFREAFEAGGGRIVGQSFPPLKGTRDYGPYLAAARAARPDALFVFFAGSAAIAFVKQYAAFDMARDVPLFGAGFLTSAAYIDAQGEAAAGFTGSLHYLPGLDIEENRDFQKAYGARHRGQVASEFAVAGYDAARLLVEAIRAAGQDKNAFKSALAKVRFTGPRGPLRIDPATNNVVQNMYVFRNELRGGRIVQRVLATIPDVQDPVNGCRMR
jgi:branched-chain amino acid transport system substrate-binding protein